MKKKRSNYKVSRNRKIIKNIILSIVTGVTIFILDLLLFDFKKKKKKKKSKKKKGR